MPQAVIRKAVGRLDVNRDFIPALAPYLTDRTKALVEQTQLRAAPDWNAVLVQDHLQKAMAV